MLSQNIIYSLHYNHHYNHKIATSRVSHNPNFPAKVSYRGPGIDELSASPVKLPRTNASEMMLATRYRD